MGTPRREENRMRRLLCGALVSVVWLGVASGSASATVGHFFLGTFDLTGVPVVENEGGVQSVSVDQTNGDVYVLKSGGVVDKFDGEGKYAGVQITGTETPQKAFSFATFYSSVAVDSSLTGNSGDVYVSDTGNHVVDRFNGATGAFECQITGSATPSATECNGLVGSETPQEVLKPNEEPIEPSGMAVDSSGNVYVADRAHSVIDKFSPSGAYIGQISDPHITRAASIALEGSGNLYVTNFISNVVKFNTKGEWSELAAKGSVGMGVDPASGDVYVSDYANPAVPIIQYDSTGKEVTTFELNTPSHAFGIGVDGSSHKIYIGNATTGDVEIWSPTIVTPYVTSEPATSVEQASAVLYGLIDPDTVHGGEPVISCEFEYGTTTAYGRSVPCVPGTQTPYSGPTNVSRTVSLAGSTEYHFRVHANSANGYVVYGLDESFTTPGAPGIAEEEALATTKSATLTAKVDAFDLATTCQAQYVSESDFQTSGYAKATTVPCTPSELSAAYGDQNVSASLTGLQLGGKYHYRFVGINGAQAGTTYGSDQVFTTFGISSFSFESVDKGGKPYTRAGGHPYQWNIKYALNTTEEQADANQKNIVTELPAGFIGNATATPQCTGYAASHSECSGSTQVGVLTIYATQRKGEKGTSSWRIEHQVEEAPVFNMVPPPGVPAQLSVNFDKFVNVYIDVNARTGGDYGLISIVHDSPTALLVKGIWLRLWGVPAEKSHEHERYCPEEGTTGQFATKGKSYAAPCGDAALPEPFLVNPSTCAGPLTAKLHIDSWSESGEYASATDSTIPATTGCEHLSFEPKLTVQPEHQIADSPSGLWVELHVPQNVSPEGLSSSTMKKAVVALPPGVSVSPSAADGLVGCSPEEIGLNNAEPPHCPDTSKIGTVEITTPLIYPTLKGEAYIAEQNNNPFDSMVAIYVTAEADGARVKLAGRVELNPVTGQLTTTFDNTPQVPFENFRLYFFGGPRGPLATPIACGTFSSSSVLTPWGAPESGPPADPGDFFSINTGCNVGFAPKFVAGVTDPQAGAYTSFVLSFSREDGEGEPKGLSMSLPPGLLGKVGEVPLCWDADANAGTCPAASQIGTVEAGAGPGSNPLFLPGKIYLTGPYKGGPYGAAVVVPAIAGPYNLGNVVVRQSLRVDPNDAHVQIVSDPFPTIVDGVPLRMRRVDVTLNRPGFMLNPTNCAPASITGSLSSVTGAVAPVESRFQLTNCGALAFKPHLVPTTSGHTSRANGASLDVTLTYPPNSVGKEANIRSVKVDLPKQLPSRLTTLQKACPDSVFNANPASCPALSRVGTATATTPLMPVTLTGPAYFVSHGGAKFPELIVVLSGDNITVYLHGETFISPAGITSSTFRNLPDVPIGVFHLVLPQGPDSALAANGNLCASKLAMPTSFNAENGLSFKQSTPIAVTGCAKNKAHKAKKASRKHRKGKTRKK